MSQIIPFNHMDKDGVFHSRTATTLHVLDKGLIEVEADDEVAFRNIESFFCDTCCKYTCGILASSDIYYQTNEQFTIPDLNSSMVLSGLHCIDHQCTELIQKVGREMQNRKERSACD